MLFLPQRGQKVNYFMNFLQKRINLFFVITVLVLLFFNLNFWQNGFFGLLLFVFFLYFVGTFWQSIFYYFFALKQKIFITRIFSYLTVFLLLGFLSSISIIFYKLDNLASFFVFVFVFLITYVLWFLSPKKRVKIKKFSFWNFDIKFRLFTARHIYLFLFIVFWILALLILLFSKSENNILFSPWQNISIYFLPIVFLLLFLSGFLIFTKFKTKTVLLVLFLLGFLLNLYLPLSHTNPWGGDVWRHVAKEKILLEDRQILPVLFGTDSNWVEFAGVNVPEIFISPYKYSYSHFWGSEVLLSRILQVDILLVNKFFIPVLFGLFISFVLFRIGQLLFGNSRLALILVWFFNLLFTFQALSSLSLPVSLGYFSFLFTLMLGLQYLRDRNPKQLKLILFFVFLQIFSYALTFILSVLFLLFGFLILQTKKMKKNIRQIYLSILYVSGIFLLPIIELVSGFSYWTQIDWLGNAKQVVGQISGWYLGSQIRPHDILSFNIWFNNTPDYAFVENIFNSWRMWLPVFMIIIFAGLVFGLLKNMFSRKNYLWQSLVFLAFLSFGGYIIGWFVLSGDRIFVRRLDFLLGFLWVVFLLFSIFYFYENLNIAKKYKKTIILLFVIVFSFFGTFSLASGPDMRVLSRDEYNISQYVWQELLSDNSEKYCVLADSWVLLALEAESSGRVIGGGFPIDYNFGQRELVELLNKVKNNLEIKDFVKVRELNSASHCLLVLEKNNFKSGEQLNKIDIELGVEGVEKNNFYFWDVNLNELAESDKLEEVKN